MRTQRPTLVLAAVATAVLAGLAVPASAAAREPLPDRVRVTEDDGYDLIREEPGPEQLDAAYIETLVASSRNPELLTFRFRILNFPASSPGTAGIHSQYWVPFTTTTRRGTRPIRGSVSWSTYYGALEASSTVDGQETPCPAEVVRDNPRTNVATLGIAKDCFPGPRHQVESFSADLRTYNFVGPDDSTSDVVENYVRARLSRPFAIR